jgi:Flp pilus assembly protein TadG
MDSTARKSQKDDRGMATVEFAIVGSLLLMLVFGILSVGLYIGAQLKATNDARQQARSAALACSSTDIANGVIVTKTVTPSFAWIVPLVPKPSAKPESVSYRCGG